MPIQYSIETDLPLVRSFLTGTVTRDDVRRHYDRLLADPRFDPAFWHLTDLTGVETFAISAADAVTEATLPVFNKGVRRAVVATTPAQLAMAHEFAKLAKRDDHLVAVFRHTAGAEAWLWSPAFVP